VLYLIIKQLSTIHPSRIWIYCT